MILGKVALFLAGVLTAIIVTGVYLSLFYQNPPLVIRNDPVLTDRSVYRSGERVNIHLDAEIRSQSPATTKVRWVSEPGNEPSAPYPITELPAASLPLGDFERDFTIVVVPSVLLPGVYHLEMETHYDVGFFLSGTSRTVKWYTQPFEVIATPPPEPRIIIQDVERPVYVFEYIYVDRPPSAITVPSVEGREPFLVSFPESPTTPPPPSSNGVSAPPSESSPAPPESAPAPPPPASPPEPPPETPKPVIIVIITPEPINVPPPTHREEAHERRDEHKAEITQRQEEHRAAIEEKKEAKQASKH